MKGKIIKGIAGFYYVHTCAGVAECKAKGIFRKDKIKPLVGDDVEIEGRGIRPLQGTSLKSLQGKVDFQQRQDKALGWG